MSVNKTDTDVQSGTWLPCREPADQGFCKNSGKGIANRNPVIAASLLG